MLKGDFHIHTSFSYDASSSPKEIVKQALKIGLNILCITDHNETKGAVEVLKYAFDKKLIVIPGIEIKSKDGDILGINIKKKIPSGLSGKETIKKIKKAGGIAIIAHPYGLPPAKRLKENLELADGFEIFNASLFKFANKKAKRLQKNFSQKAITAGSDAHFPKFLGRGKLLFEGENLDEKKILEKILKKEVKISGREYTLFEKIEDHFKRTAVKVKNALSKKRKI